MATVPGSPDGLSVLVHEHVSGGGFADALSESWLAEGSAMRRAIACDFAAAGARVFQTLDLRMPDEPGPWTTVRISPGEAAECLPRLAARVDHTILIAPETGGLLRDLTTSIVRSGADQLGSSPDAIDLTADKFRLAGHLIRLGVPHPSTRLVHPRWGLPRDAVYPAVLKPIDGAGAVDTLLLASFDDPIVATFPDERGILQPFLPGEPRSATFLILTGSAPFFVGVGRQAIALRDGRFGYGGGTILPDDLPPGHPTRRAAASVPGLAGLVGVDYLHDPVTSRSVVLEINPRPTTSCVGLVASLGPGRLASTWLALARRGPLARVGAPAHRRPVTFRADGEIHPVVAAFPAENLGR